MSKFLRVCCLLVLLVPLAANAMVEPDTKKEYPDEVTVGAGDAAYTLVGTGVGLREKTFLKVDVYVIASYVCSKAQLGENKAQELMDLDGNKRIVMDLTRSFSADKLKKALTEIIDKNFKDQSAFADDLATLVGYFTEEAREGDHLVFDYQPAMGLTVSLNDETKGVLKNYELARAIWSVWFGDSCADKGVRKDLLKKIS